MNQATSMVKANAPVLSAAVFALRSIVLRRYMRAVGQKTSDFVHYMFFFCYAVGHAVDLVSG